MVQFQESYSQHYIQNWNHWALLSNIASGTCFLLSMERTYEIDQIP